jgi:hypothetical protein
MPSVLHNPTAAMRTSTFVGPREIQDDTLNRDWGANLTKNG